MPDPLDFAGRVVVVTGGARGVGRGIAECFLASGADVVVCGRNQPDDPPTVGARSATFRTADVRDSDQVEALLAAVVEQHGGLDVLVNNAGGSPPADAATASPRLAAAIVDLNLVAPMRVAQAANAIMQQQDSGGVVIGIASVSGLRPSPGTAAYGAAKAGLVNLTQSLAIEWAPKVRVNCVTPGLIETEQSHLHYGEGPTLEAVAATVPLGRMGRPTDVGDACVFLASPLASYISGANLVVHGGGERPTFLAAATPEPGR